MNDWEDAAATDESTDQLLCITNPRDGTNELTVWRTAEGRFMIDVKEHDGLEAMWASINLPRSAAKQLHDVLAEYLKT